MVETQQQVQQKKELIPSLEQLVRLLQPLKEQSPWLLGGSCGLLLHGVKLDKAPRDIDLYTDEIRINDLHEKLAEELPVLDYPILDETRTYRSTLSHYQLDPYTVELVGGFEVRARESYYRVHVEPVLYPAAPVYTLEAGSIHLMPLAHELIFNLLRDRPDRYEPISERIREQSQDHATLIEQIIQHNGFHPQFMQRIRRLAGING
ncbi:hypothetical protein ACFSGI_07360 [Paenibacillus nicotianae]|uniref:Nucleotidyl transferase AbiEii toxin, Type IV TA system n=1 Tax=Paenibacillus nicotianae TaxID=1526551 RepID=A0ABW4US19_9BACL